MYIDRILTHHSRCFQRSAIYKKGSSDFPKVALTILKIFYAKEKARVVIYRDQEIFNDVNFRNAA